MTRTIRFLAVTGAATAALVAGALADPPRPIAVGQSAQGTLNNADAKGDNNAFYEDHTVRLAANQNVEALMASSAFDAFLRIGRGVGSAFEELKSDDDSGGGTDARVRFAAPAEGVYTVRASALNEGMSGAYTLRLSAYAPPPPPTTRPIAFGSTENGRLADGGSRLEDGDKLFDQYSLTAAAGERIRVETKSAEFDSVVSVGRMVDGAFEEVKSDDDSGGDKNARLLAALEQPGEYILRVFGFDRDAKGAYTVSLNRLPPAAAEPRPKTIRVGQVVRGELTDASPTFDDFRGYDYYQLTGRRGQKVTIIMRAEFDAFLDVGVLSPAGFAILKSDDDGGGDTNAKIELTFDRAGTVIIRTSPLHGGASGPYSLSVE